MSILIPHALFTCCIIAFYYVWYSFRKMDLHYKENILFIFTCIGSGVWSLGFYGIMVQTDPDIAYYWRLVGMAGVFGFMIFITTLVTYLAGVKKCVRRMIYGYTYLGIILYFGLTQKDLVEYNMAFFGMSYSFKNSIWNDLYTIYSVVLAVIMCIVLFWLYFTTDKKRLKVLAKKLLLADFIVILGMIFDTILPVFGVQAFPGSTFGQFIGTIVLYQAILFINNSRIEVDNISKFIYYSLDLPVILYDDNKKLRLANNCADVFFDFNGENLEQYDIDKLFKVDKNVFEFETKRKDIPAVYKANDTQCNLSINKVFDGYGDIIGYIVFVNDLTNHMKTIERLEEAILDADRANKAKSVFLANMSHEIRTPIHAIIGFSELVLKSEINSQVREYVEDIRQSSNNLLVIINDILDISKIESGKMELVTEEYYISALIKDVSLIIATQAEQKELNYIVDIDDNIPSVIYGDKVRLRGVIVNILNNAVKYTNSGCVSFSAKIREKNNEKVWLEFKIKDTGIGIKKEDIPNLFKKFERLDVEKNSNVEGSGLGLSIANGYVKLMGGEIQVNSVYGEGTEFTVIVPQGIVDATPFDKNYIYGKDNNEITDGFHINSVEVLVVDDNKVNLRMAQGLFGSYGFKVDITDNGQSAIDICTQKCYPIVFMDQMMPQIDGITAMQEIRKRNSYYDYGNEGKIIVLTADAISGARERLLNAGFDDYIGKPFDVKKLESIFLKYVPKENVTFEKSAVASDNDNKTDFIKELEEKLPILDVRTGVSYCGNDPHEYLEILKIAYEHGDRRINELHSCREKGDYRNYTIHVHSLKSTAKNIGATEISEMALKQEIAGNNGDYIYIDEHCEELLESYSLILKSIHKVLEEYGLITNTAGVIELDNNDDEYLDDDTVKVLLESILNYLDKFEFDSIFDILDDIDGCVLKKDDKMLFDSVRKSMDNLAVDEVRELITGNI